MKEVRVLRHGEWVRRTDNLTEDAVVKCLSLRNRLGHFDMVLASPFDRTIETARLITSSYPLTDSRAGIPALNSEETARLFQIAAEHSLGIAGALFSTPAFLPRVKAAGAQLVELIQEVLTQLPENGKALIVTHEGTLCAAEKLLTRGDFSSLTKTYYELEGFVVSEDGSLRSFSYRKDGEL